MLRQLRAQLTLVLLSISCLMDAQGFIPHINRDSVSIDIGIERHMWQDSNYYQFIAVNVIGLPEVNTVYSPQLDETLNKDDMPMRNLDLFGGAYNPPFLVSRDFTFYPVKTNKEVVYDSNTTSNRIKLTSLFLVDEFRKIKKKETVLLVAKGMFGHQMQSQAYFDYFVADFSFSMLFLKTDDSYPVADLAWYKSWLKDAPKGYWDQRAKNNHYEQHQNYDHYLSKTKIG